MSFSATSTNTIDTNRNNMNQLTKIVKRKDRILNRKERLGRYPLHRCDAQVAISALSDGKDRQLTPTGAWVVPKGRPQGSVKCTQRGFRRVVVSIFYGSTLVVRGFYIMIVIKEGINLCKFVSRDQSHGSEHMAASWCFIVSHGFFQRLSRDTFWLLRCAQRTPKRIPFEETRTTGPALEATGFSRRGAAAQLRGQQLD